METHFTLTDAEFERLFESCSFDPALFTHEAHIRLAWIHIRKYGLDKASCNVVSQLQEYTTALGVADKFDLGLTISSLRIINHFIMESTDSSFEMFIKEFPNLNTHFKDLLLQYPQLEKQDGIFV
ncbi:hypothetical protein OGH69_13765 [Flavobacterium sp. MFBS3-15]|uniref:hypothetical protein n=1 Tax=Flavobacterium sp. MFBS3-15 TaxID=2989816 RepID=UPI0022358F5A|nr:hypothetical protein [Flavobacterium sp. MFBS3-15]MCW4470040.1 hypothetical protein [Flavobacterium sp. MFBS3-15]